MAKSRARWKQRLVSELLERRLLLDAAADAAIEKFNFSPAVFVENSGQWTDSSVRFVHQGKGASIAMTDRGPIFELYRGVTPVDSSAAEHRLDSRFDEPIEQSIETTRFSVSFKNSNTTSPVGHDRSSSTFNYNIGDVSQHRSNVSGFEKIVYPSLYEGIDLHTWGQRDSLKYEFHVSPNIDYRQIAVQYEGVEDLWIDKRGRLHAELGNGFGEVIDDAPVIWQEVKGKRVDVAGRFKLLDGDAYTFELGTFDPKLPLVIDPDLAWSSLAWSSYLGGGNATGTDISVDANGDVLVTGSTASSGWAAGGFDTSFNGTSDVFVAKINADGTLAWSTYLGGSDYDHDATISADADGNAWISGETSSSDWTVGGFDTSYDGADDLFVAKINANGTLAWSSYLGGSGYDRNGDIAVDAEGNGWLTGTTDSYEAVGGFDIGREGLDEAIIAKINADGSLAWSSYLGGSSWDNGRGISVDSHGNAWVTGSTNSPGWTVGGFDTTYNVGSDHWDDDAFVAKINANGSLAWSSYLGGSADDHGVDISMDTHDNAWITGTSDSTGWTVGGFDTNSNNGHFVAKINANGTVAWSRYVGGGSLDYGADISVDPDGNAWVAGLTRSSGWAVGGFDTSFNSDRDYKNDAYVAKINANGTMAWISYLGGINDDRGTGIALDSDGNAWVTGWTRSSGWMVGGFDTSFNDEENNEAFVAKITNAEPLFSPLTVTGTFDNDSVSITRDGDALLVNINGFENPRQIETISSIYISTGNGNDTITVGDDVMGVTIDAGDGNDRIIGSDNADYMYAGWGNDYIVANGGNDTVNGDDGKDTLAGSAGRDKLYGDNDEDRIRGGKGNDTISGGSGDDRLYGNEDNDSIDGGGNVDRIWGGVGNDTLNGGGSNDKLYGEGGSDLLVGNSGADLINGGSGTDRAKDEDDENLYLSIESYF